MGASGYIRRIYAFYGRFYGAYGTLKSAVDHSSMNRKLSDSASLTDAVYSALVTCAPGNSDRPIKVYCSAEERLSQSFKDATEQLIARGLKVAVFRDHVNVYKDTPRFASAAEKKAWKTAHARPKCHDSQTAVDGNATGEK